MKGAVMKSKLDGFEVQHLNAEVAEVFAKGAEEKRFAFLCEFLCVLCG